VDPGDDGVNCEKEHVTAGWRKHRGIVSDPHLGVIRNLAKASTDGVDGGELAHYGTDPLTSSTRGKRRQ
jgi:hypothetical protein